ncbi:hypothetical protein BpHYR1_004793 [Brachionus plicatilis]|uniref:Uncharacterized protein n=1 Tax=Brachionus plicatilis TaxID=10195 RepID=A0A3M7PX86_BRAPC|nr:hypothetical protein BpHYR1_004793 [Brachionus plicatilis]
MKVLANHMKFKKRQLNYYFHIYSLFLSSVEIVLDKSLIVSVSSLTTLLGLDFRVQRQRPLSAEESMIPHYYLMENLEVPYSSLICGLVSGVRSEVELNSYKTNLNYNLYLNYYRSGLIDYFANSQDKDFIIKRKKNSSLYHQSYSYVQGHMSDCVEFVSQERYARYDGLIQRFHLWVPELIYYKSREIIEASPDNYSLTFTINWMKRPHGFFDLCAFSIVKEVKKIDNLAINTHSLNKKLDSPPSLSYLKNTI